MQFREIKTPVEAEEDIQTALMAGQYATGPFVEMVETRMREVSGAAHAIAVASGTIGLKIALDAMGIRPGDMVIIPDITFIACATVVIELNAIPVFVDVDPVTLVLDEKSTTQAILKHGSQIKAIMAVRLGGQPIPDWVYGLCVPVIVDSAHSMDPIPEKALACVYSFHPSKIVSGIEGGCIATNSAGDAQTARQLRMFGFQEGTRVATMYGYKGYMSNLSAILIWHNLAVLGANLASRARLRDRFNARLGFERQGLGMYMILSSNPEALSSKIPAIQHYPIPLSMMCCGVPQNEMAFKITQSLVSLPFHEHLSDEDVEYLCDIVTGISN